VPALKETPPESSATRAPRRDPVDDVMKLHRQAKPSPPQPMVPRPGLSPSPLLLPLPRSATRPTPPTGQPTLEQSRSLLPMSPPQANDPPSPHVGHEGRVRSAGVAFGWTAECVRHRHQPNEGRATDEVGVGDEKEVSPTIPNRGSNREERASTDSPSWRTSPPTLSTDSSSNSNLEGNESAIAPPF
jgi:hypothetical protein